MKLRLFCVLLCALIGLGGCASPSGEQPLPTEPEVEEYQEEDITPQPGGTLKLGLYAVDTLNPLLTANAHNAQVLKIMYDGLFRTETDLSMSNRLCDRFTVSDDCKTYTFYLRQGVQFHDGSQLTAQDVVYSFELVSRGNGVYKERLANMQACTASGGAVRVTLQQPDSNFIAFLDFPIVKRSSYMPDTKASPQPGLLDGQYRPNGTGMYKLADYRENRDMTLAINDVWSLGSRPYIEQVHIKLLPDKQTAVYAFENMEIDVLSSDVINLGEYAPKRNLKRKEYAKETVCFLGINTAKAKFAGNATREALSCLLDRDRVVTTLLGGRADAAYLPVHPQSWLYDGGADGLQYDPTRAKTLLAQDGWEDSDQNGILDREFDTERADCIMEILVNEENAARVKIAHQLSESMTQAGIYATVKQVSFTEYQQLVADGSYDVYVGEMRLPRNQSVDALFAANTDETLAGLLAGVQLAGAQGLESAYGSLNAYLWENLPVIGICFNTGALLFDERVKGEINPVESDMFAGLEYWFLSDAMKQE